MSTAQRIIKYFAVGFAAFLSFTIISAIVFGALGILGATKLIKSNSNVEISCEVDEAPCLEISLGASELVIKKGETFSAESTYDHVEIKQDGDRMVITEKDGSIFDDYNRTTTVYVPEDMVFNKAGIAGGAGRIYIESLNAKELEIALGVGETVINNLEFDSAKIDSGIGSVNVKLASDESKYAIKADKGIGKITFNGKGIGDSEIGNGESEIKISGGIGEININTAEKKAEVAE